MLPFDKLLPIDRTAAPAVYQQVANSMIQHIRSGVLKPGLLLPGTRELAGILGIHRKTVVAAFDELSAQGWIEAVARKGFHVTRKLPEVRPGKWAKGGSVGKGGEHAFSREMAAPFYPVGKGRFRLPELTVPPPRLIIDDGHPDSRLAPLELLGREYRARLNNRGGRRQVYAVMTAGSPRMREAMVGYLADTRGMQASVPNILITHGAQMSIYIAAQLLLRPGDAVIVGEPGYYVATQVFENLGANLLRAPVDEQGIDVDVVERLCRGKAVRMLYLVPHHHHPTTVTLSPERRMRLLEIAEKYNFSIVEDDYDYDFHYSSSPYLPLAASGHNNRVIYIGSFSKSLSSSIRVGFMVGPEAFIIEAVYLRRLIELRGDNHMEDALAELIRNGDVGRHLKKVNRIYEGRRDWLCSLLDTHLAGVVEYRKPSGGMAVWARFSRQAPVKELAGRALKMGLYMSDGQAYNTHNKDYNAIRIGFASLNEEEMDEAIRILKNCL
jgi:GntR family transcriptional regulator/MocR family aminotransferase